MDVCYTCERSGQTCTDFSRSIRHIYITYRIAVNTALKPWYSCSGLDQRGAALRSDQSRLTCVMSTVFYSLSKLCLYRYFWHFHFGRILFVFLMFSAKKGEKCIFNPINRKYQSQCRRLTFYINCMISLNETLQNEKKKEKKQQRFR